MALFEDERREDRSDLAGASVGEAIMNELVKSYGFGRNPDGSWGWSTERIGKAFEESPVWTTLDYLTLAAPVLKWGRAIQAVKAGRALSEGGFAARTVSKLSKGRLELAGGSNVVAKARAAGDFATDPELGRAALRSAGYVERGLNRLLGVSDETQRAAAMYRRGASPWALRYARKQGTYSNIGLNSPLTQELSDEYRMLLDKHGGEWWERRAVTQVADRERRMAEMATGRNVKEIQRAYTGSGATQEQLAGAERLLSKWVDPSDPRVAEALGNNRAALEAYRQDLGFRQWLHGAAFDTGLISRRAYNKGIRDGYAPRLAQEWERIKARIGLVEPGSFQSALDAAPELAEEAVRRAGGKAKAPILGPQARLAARQLTEEEFEARFTRILDPRASLADLMGAAQLVHRQTYAQSIAGSIVAKSSKELSSLAQEIAADATGRLARIHGITPKRLEAVRGIIADAPSVGRELQLADQDIAKLLGWKRLGDMAADASGGAQKFMRGLPKPLRDKWIDPNAVGDIAGQLSFLDEDGLFNTFHKHVLQTFQAGKTAYNPATHVRNFLSGPIFSSLARGGPIKLAPGKGYRAWKEGLKNADYKAWVDAVGAGAGFDPKDRDALAALGASLDGVSASALDWMGSSQVAQWIQGQATKAETLYRSIDEWWSLDTFIELTAKYKGQGMDLAQARMLATRDVRKFMPNYGILSDIGETLRSGLGGNKALAVPFVSFTAESARIWSNVLTEKPHMAFFWNHVMESMGNVFGSIAGFSPEQIEEAKKALPEYTEGKKMTLLPFNVDGQPMFIDTSYLIPLGNLGEAQQSDQSFFGTALDMTANPILGAGVALAANQDPFTGRELAPRFTERQFGVPVANPTMRRMVGLAEHMAAMMLPPLAPPGYAGVNLMEYVRGQVNPATGEPLEDGVVRTIAGNLFGFRGYQADVESQVLNVRAEQRRSNESISQAWQRWDFARYNGDPEAMEVETQRILELKMGQGFTQSEARDYVAQQAESREPFNNISRRQMREIMRRSGRLGRLSPEQEGLRQRLQQRLAGG